VSQPASLLLPTQFGVEARYSGDSLDNASTGTLSQRVQYGWPAFTSPADDSTVKAGATVPVRFQLTDSAGKPLPDVAALLLTLTCQLKVSVTGAQTLAPACVQYDLSKHRFSYDWKSAKTSVGAVQLTVQVPIAGGTAQTRSVKLTLQP
jgi:hypothetical protein